MAKIPMGDFGNRVPQGPETTPQQQLDTQVSDANVRLGATATQIGGTILAEQKIKAEEEQRKVEQVQTLTTHAAIQNGLADSYDAINADVLSGKTDKVAATAAWKEASGKIVGDNVANLPSNLQPLVSAQVQGLQGQLTNKLFDTFRKRDQEDVAASMLTYRESQQRFAQTDPGAAVKQFNTYAEQIGPSAGWNPERIAKEKQVFLEGVTYNGFRKEAQGLMQANDVAGLDKLQMRMTGPEGDPLDPAKKNTLDQTIFGWKQAIEARADRQAGQAEREATKRFNTATDTLNKGREIALSGGFLAPDYIATMTEQAQGTGLEKDVTALLASQKQVAGFASANPTQRAAVLESARSARADPAKGVDPQDEQLLKRAEQIDASLKKKVDDGEAWSAAQSVGIVKAAPLLNIANPQEAVKVFQSRMADQGTVEAWAGKKVSPLQPPEAEQLTKMVRTLKPDAAASLLGQIGAVVNDPERIAAIGKQIGDKDGTLGMAMMYANSKTTEGRYTAQLILEGELAIKDKSVRVDGAVETGWRGDIAKKVRGAYSNQEVENNVVEAAFKIAAAKNGDVDNAINLATGGIVERNGGKVPLPYGMKEPEFEKRLGAITPASLADQTPDGVVMVGPNRVPIADFVKTIPDARLVHAGQGAYNVRAGNNLVTNERGQRITLKVGP